VRGSFEEGLIAAPQDEAYVRLPANVTLEKPRHPRSKWGTYVPGITGRHPLLKEELVNLPYFMDLRLSVDGEDLDMDRCVIEGHQRRLALRDAVLHRHFTWKTASGAVLEASYRRFVSRARPRVCVQEVEYRCLTGQCTLRIASGIDARVKTNGHDHFADVACSARGGRAEVLLTTDTGDTVALCSETRAGGLTFEPLPREERRPAGGARTRLRAGDTVLIVKISAVATSRDPRTGTSLPHVEDLGVPRPREIRRVRFAPVYLRPRAGRVLRSKSSATAHPAA
jgi:kojibiose phosphorylase